VGGIFNVRLAELVTVSSDSKGVCAGFIPSDPSSTGLNISEFAQFANLFAQVRLMRMRISIVPTTNYGTGGDTSGFALASTMGLPGTPTSMSVVVDNADGKLVNLIRLVSSHGYMRTLKMTTRPTWADVTSVNPGENVGCPGGFIYYSDNQPASVRLLDILVEVYVQFRSRS